MKNNEEVAIRVSNVSKSFKLPHEKTNSIKSIIINPFKKRTYEKQQALKNVSFEIKKGEFFGIIGKNGSGKSTLLKLLAGIYSPNEGKIEVNGKLTPFIELGVGFNPELTGRENVFLNGALLGFSRKEMSEMYDEIVEFAELERFMDQKLKNYSSGMQVRLAFSIAIRAKSDILLLDEVLAVGDMSFQKKCFNYFKQLKQQNKTVVFVSHDMNAVKEYCDNGVLIHESKIVQTRSFNEVISSYIKIMNPKTADELNKPKMEISNNVKIVNKNIVIKKDKINFSIKISFQEFQQENYYVAFSVKNNIEQKILGTNTEIYNLPITPSVKKDIYELTCEMLNVLANGEYSINLSVFNENKSLQASFEDILQFQNNHSRDNYFSINPVTKLQVN